MYHSTALLLADGAVLISGSNPNKDVTTAQWSTNSSVEKWYPLWYSQARPQPSAFPSSLTYVCRPITSLWLLLMSLGRHDVGPDVHADEHCCGPEQCEGRGHPHRLLYPLRTSY